MLHLQLKRYEYDMQLDAMVKVRLIYAHGQAIGNILIPPKDRRSLRIHQQIVESSAIEYIALRNW